MTSLPETLSQAIRSHQMGDLKQAEHFYRQILQVDPQHIDALHLLGLIAHQVGRHDLAAEYIGRALHLKPDFAEAHYNLGLVLRTQGRLAEAVACWQQALRCNPGYAEAHNNLGNVLMEQGRLAEAVARFQQALRLKPDYAQAHFNLGFTLAAQGQTAEAIASYRQALRLQPDYAEAHYNLGNALLPQGQLAEAVACYQQALHLRPAHAEAHYYLGNAFAKQSRLAEAVASFRQALGFKPELAEAHNNLGNALHEQGREEEAVACYRQALRWRPDFAEAHHNLGNALHEQGREEEAVACYRQALRWRPDYADGYRHLGDALRSQGNLEEAAACYREAVRLRPDYAEAHNNWAALMLLTGDFEAGWQKYEWRWRRPEALPAGFSQSRWDGSALTSKTVLLCAEQGLGDTLLFIRYAPLVKQRGATVVVTCQQPLLRLLKSCAGINRLVAVGSPLPPFDAYAPLLSLPSILGTTLATIPAEVPYLSAPTALVEHWRRQLADIPAFKVGIVWQCSPQFRSSYRERSVPLAHFGRLARLEGVQLVSLQKDPTASLTFAPPEGFPFRDLSGNLTDFLDTAAIIKNLDLVITVDTAVAHLAGALGVPVWVAVPFAPDWRWLLDRDDSPWYPTMRLFRQTEPGNWANVFARIAVELERTQALRLKPDYAQAHNNLGYTLAGQGQPAEAIASYRQALRLQPDYAEAHYNLGNALQAQGQMAEAAACYQQALRLKPAYGEAHYYLGNALARQNQLATAVASYQQALRFKPDLVEAHINLGNALAALGRLAEAVVSYQQVLRLQPSCAEVHFNLGNALKAQDQPAEAAASYQQALRLKPDYAEAHVNMGTVLLDQDRLEEAIACFQQALRLKPDLAEAHYNLGNVFLKQEQLAEAMASYRQALCLQPDYADAHFNLGNAFKAQYRLEEAVACFRHALRLKPDLAEAHNNLGNALASQDHLAEALACYQQALQLKPDYAEAHKNHGMTWLLMGHFEQGWPEYEWRWREPKTPLPRFRQPLWDGTPLQGQTILLHAEQGLGDTLQFIRYAPLVQQRGGTVLVACQAPLLRILANVVGIDGLVVKGSHLPSFDVYAPMLSLPGILHTTLTTIPSQVPYLSAEAALVEHWRRQLAETPGFKVGIAWQGNPKFPGDRQRSMPLAHFAPLARLEGVQLISLQKGPAASQVAALAEPFPIRDLSASLDDFVDTAAIMKNLDLFVTSDTSVAHLAGALGVPVWVALSFAPDWRWLLDREDCPWYPTMRLFRQTEPGNWPAVFARIAAELERKVAVTRECLP